MNKAPVEIDGHWNCGICNCSHKFYDDAYECCNNNNKIPTFSIQELIDIEVTKNNKKWEAKIENFENELWRLESINRHQEGFKGMIQVSAVIKALKDKICEDKE